MGKYISGTKTREELCQSLDHRSNKAIRDSALKKGDDRILTIILNDTIASKVNYHKSCYKIYTKNFVREKHNRDCDPEEAKYQEIQKEAYQQLFSHIRETIFNEPQAVKLTKLTDKLLDIMEVLGCNRNDIQPQIKKHIRRKLEGEFGESLHFLQSSNGRVLVYPDSLSLEILVIESVQLKEKLFQSPTSDEKMHDIKSAASYIHDDIKRMNSKPWPPELEELNSNYVQLPESLVLFLTVLLGLGNSDKLNRILQSIGQDAIYAVSGGRVIPAKHILLPWAVKSLTGNVQLIKILNRLGHGMSYDKLEEMDTALCLNKLSMEPDLGVILPTKTYPGAPTTMAFDNIDRIEETLSGSCTSHRVNGIIIQPQVATASLPTRYQQHQQVHMIINFFFQ